MHIDATKSRVLENGPVQNLTVGNNNQQIEVEVTGMAFGGKGIA